MDPNIQIRLEMIRDEQLGTISRFLFQIYSSLHSSVTVKEIYKWLSPPQESVNYNAAYSILKSQQDTCLWFLNGNTFSGWLNQPGFLWVKGKCMFIVKNCKYMLLTMYPAGSGKTILRLRISTFL